MICILIPALAERHQVRDGQLEAGTKDLGVLELGQVVQVQNQTGNHAKKWDLSGTVVEVQGYDSYLVKMDGRVECLKGIGNSYAL